MDPPAVRAADRIARGVTAEDEVLTIPEESRDSRDDRNSKNSRAVMGEDILADAEVEISRRQHHGARDSELQVLETRQPRVNLKDHIWGQGSEPVNNRNKRDVRQRDY